MEEIKMGLEEREQSTSKLINLYVACSKVNLAKPLK